jgi:hypothetical protein
MDACEHYFVLLTLLDCLLVVMEGWCVNRVSDCVLHSCVL